MIGNRPFLRCCLLLLTAFCLQVSADASQLNTPSAPDEIRSDHFTVTINGKAAAVSHAAANYYFLNFDISGPAKIAITAPTDDFWAKGVEVQPWRWGIRPEVDGRTISFTIAKPAKLSITRPGDHSATSEMLFLFANPPEVGAPKNPAAATAAQTKAAPGKSARRKSQPSKNVPSKNAEAAAAPAAAPAATPALRYYGPGVYHENIDAKSGDTIYLAPGAVIFGSLNLWEVENVKVFGRGTIVYDGPQKPDADEAWMHKPNWHVIVMHNAHHIQISGITCVVRSRTWMIQMQDSRDITFDNVKVIGGSKGNANQDGMDWLGGGNTLVKDTFIRAADDIFAMYGNWDGYTEEALTTPGHDVSDITIENSVLSTSISNVVRAGWPKKIFNSNHFTMRDSDVIHMGLGGCGVPFALFEIWADPAGKGQHSKYSFENIRMEDWYSLVQLRQPNPSIRDVTFSNIWALETPSMVPSALKGDVQGVSIANFKVASEMVDSAKSLPIEVLEGAGSPAITDSTSGPTADFAFTPSAISPGKDVTFDASNSTGAGVTYDWTFGDGTSARGKVVHHKFADADGTLRDGSGRFRVLLKITSAAGKVDWAYRPVIVADGLEDAETASDLEPGLHYRAYASASIPTQDLDKTTATADGRTQHLDETPRPFDGNYSLVFDGYIDVPADGGYTFLLLSRDGGQLQIGSKVIAESPAPIAQVCGSVGNALQPAMGSIALQAGKHTIRISMTHTVGEHDFALYWQIPNGPLVKVRDSAFLRPATAAKK